MSIARSIQTIAEAQAEGATIRRVLIAAAVLSVSIPNADHRPLARGGCIYRYCDGSMLYLGSVDRPDVAVLECVNAAPGVDVMAVAVELVELVLADQLPPEGTAIVLTVPGRVHQGNPLHDLGDNLDRPPCPTGTVLRGRPDLRAD